MEWSKVKMSNVKRRLQNSRKNARQFIAKATDILRWKGCSEGLQARDFIAWAEASRASEAQVTRAHETQAL